MSKVEPFASGKAVWHMHPVAFLDAINGQINTKNQLVKSLPSSSLMRRKRMKRYHMCLPPSLQHKQY